MISFSNEELEVLPPLLPEEHCPQCKKLLPLTYGKVYDPNTKVWVETKTLACVDCPECKKLFLIGVAGKVIQ